MSDPTPDNDRTFNAMVAAVEAHFSLYDSALAVATGDKLLDVEELKVICKSAEKQLQTIWKRNRVRVTPTWTNTNGVAYPGYDLTAWFKNDVSMDYGVELDIQTYGIEVELPEEEE